MKYLITGANGQLGRALQKEINKSDNEIYLYDVDTMDITDYEQVKNIILDIIPDVIFNCAAHTNVDKCEEDIDNAYKINAIGAQNLAMIAEHIDSKLVHFSTDYVFSGEDEIPRIESDFANPKTVYGKSKLYGEELVKQFCSKYFIIRTAWLYGDGNNFVRTMLNLSKQNDKLTVVGDQFGSPTYTKDLAKAALNLSKTKYYGLYHGTCQGNCSWYDFACKIFELMNIDIEVEKVTSEQFLRPAKRPAYSILDNFMLRLRGLDTFRHWEESLKEYLQEDRQWQNLNL
ncbi:dTDP-4-dehydrorhamnose reductase [Peptoanaerobacter stomatis]|uniref:dTDP-4-dehydrorhamnose reductase n=1 Tax=Peptoanaerobacter stomatis TaxID=796937 RepID=J6HEN6_9FIRM|nr:dTDP-4-dehydrorhamnose reductase [Peptoanaerobacter stomatis]EJU23500.1 dTDP-4-dehydrorhamnose reductase [Peptoanaerobacter stomatis]NWO24576.1 dTDP-4-dehydrorhamnose reductase [Peptostreptococcaceae bacterium oral taxon 081]